MSDDDINLAAFDISHLVRNPAAVRAEEKVSTQACAGHIKRTDAAAKRPVVIPQRWIDALLHGGEPSSGAVLALALRILEMRHHQNSNTVCVPAAAVAKLGYSRRTGIRALARLAELSLILPKPSPGRPTTYAVIL